MKARRWTGFLLLAATVGLLYYYAFTVATSENPSVAFVIGIAGMFLLYGFYLEKDAVTAPWKGPLFQTNDLYLFCSVFAGGVISYWLNVNLGLGAVVAAALVGVLADTLVPSYAAPLYCGSFVGMASPKVLNSTQLLLAAALAGVIYVLAQDVFNGFGGKLGTIACAGCMLSALLSGKALLSGQVPSGDVSQKIVVTAIQASVVAYFLNVEMGKGAVMGSAVVGLFGGLVLPAMFPEVGDTLATACICASFAGMSSKARVPNEALMAVAGVVVGLVFIYSSPHLGGAGGKLGTTAFGSVIAVNAMLKALGKTS